jgi:5-methylthioadenosine/S-adenosylhomocysteine deaminase
MPDAFVMQMATTEGSKVVQMENAIGSLEVGKKADIVLLRDRSTVPIFEYNVKNYIVGTCEKADVDTVIVDGEVLLKNGEFVNLDEERVRAQCQETAVKLWKRNGWPTP